MVPTREIYGNIVGGEWVYAFMAVSFGILGWALFRRCRLWMQGRPENRLNDVWRRCKAMLVYGLGQQKTLREWPGVLHFCMYVGFVVLFIGTLMVAVHEDLGIEFLHGPFYLVFSLTLTCSVCCAWSVSRASHGAVTSPTDGPGQPPRGPCRSVVVPLPCWSAVSSSRVPASVARNFSSTPAGPSGRRWAL